MNSIGHCFVKWGWVGFLCGIGLMVIALVARWVQTSGFEGVAGNFLSFAIASGILCIFGHIMQKMEAGNGEN